MRKIFFFAALCLFSNLSQARVPLEQCIDLYDNTKTEYQEISPVWAEIMLQSGQLKNIRFFGNLSSQRHDAFPPHPSFEGEKLHLNAPQDPIMGVLQYLFPSPNGQELIINQRKNDPIGKLSRKEHLGLLNELLLLAVHKGEHLFERTLEVLRKLPREKSSKTRKTSDAIAYSFAELFAKAILFEGSDSRKTYYPEHILMHSLFAFALNAADNIDEIYDHFGWIFKDQKIKSNYDKQQYDDFLVNLKKSDDQIETGKLIKRFLGIELFEKPTPRPLNYYDAVYQHNGENIYYPNCGEASLLNFFYYNWGVKGVINPDFIAETESKLNRNHVHPETHRKWEEIKDYFRDFPTMDSSLSNRAKERWSQLISNLNREDTDPSLKVIYRQDVCNTQGVGIINMLNVLEKIIPDQAFSEAFAEEPKLQFELASRKIDRLCDLFSRHIFRLDWNVEHKKEIDSPFVYINFTNCETPYFVWQFKDGSFGFQEAHRIDLSWAQHLDTSNLPSLLKAFCVSFLTNETFFMITPSELFGLNLLSLHGAYQGMSIMVQKNWLDMMAVLVQLIEKTFAFEVAQGQRLLYETLRGDYKIVNQNEDHIFYNCVDFMIQRFFDSSQPDQLLQHLISSPNNMERLLNKYVKGGFGSHTHRIENIEANCCASNSEWLSTHLDSLKVVFSKDALEQFLKCVAKSDRDNTIELYEKKFFEPTDENDLLEIAVKAGASNLVKHLIEEKNIPYDIASWGRNSFLHSAATSEKPDLVAYFIQKGLDPNALNKDAVSPLHFLCEKRHNGYSENDVNIIKILLENGANPFEENKNSFVHLFKFYPDFNELIELTRKSKNKLNNKTIYSIFRRYSPNHINIEKLKIFVKEFNVNLNNRQEAYLQYADDSLRYTQGETLLHQAVKEYATELIAFLLSEGMDPNAKSYKGLTPLHLLFLNVKADCLPSIAGDNDCTLSTRLSRSEMTSKLIEIADLLLANGATIDEKDIMGATPFLCALPYIMYDSNIDLFHYLCEKGADISARDIHGNGKNHYVFKGINTKLGHMDSYTKEFFVHKCQELNIDFQDQDKRGETPLFTMIKELGNRRIFWVLLGIAKDHGVSLNQKNAHGEFAIVNFAELSWIYDQDIHQLIEDVMKDWDQASQAQFVRQIIKRSENWISKPSYWGDRLSDKELFLKSWLDSLRKRFIPIPVAHTTSVVRPLEVTQESGLLNRFAQYAMSWLSWS